MLVSARNALFQGGRVLRTLCMLEWGGKYLLVLWLGMAWNPCLAGEQSRISEEYVPSAEELAWEQWGNGALLDMANSQTPWMRAALAAHFATRKDPQLATIGHEKFEAIALLPVSDPLTLWHLARYCTAFRQSSTCKEQQIIERLGQADPKNIAALLVVDQYRSSENWATPDAQSPENQVLLQRLAEADVYDQFWGRGSSELLETLEEYSRQTPPPKMPELVTNSMLDPRLILLFPIFSMEGWSPGYSKLQKLCETMADAGDQSAIRQCLRIARTMQESDSTLLTVTIGISIEQKVQTAIDPGSAESLFAARKHALRLKSGMCGVPILLQGRSKVILDDTMIAAMSSAWLRDLDTLGEVQAMQRAAEREFALYPDEYSSNPSDCPDVLAMSNSELAAYLGADDPALKPEQSPQ
jgi:hypothetical protein